MSGKLSEYVKNIKNGIAKLPTLFKNMLSKIKPFMDKILKRDDNGKISKKRLVMLIVCVAVILIFVITGFARLFSDKKANAGYETAKVEKGNISRTVDVSSTIEANDTYNVTALVTGEILSDNFNEGDIVEKDTVLYTIESSDAQNKVTQAENSLKKAQQDFSDAVKRRTDTIKSNGINKSNSENSVTKALNSVETARTNYNNLTITSDYTGTITEVLVNDGDSVGDGTKLAKIADMSKFKIQVPFNEADIGGIVIGSTAELTLAKSGDKLYGTVSSISAAATATASHAIVRYITITVNNPGALTEGENASAVIGNVSCSDLGKLEYCESGYITAKTSGKIGDLYLEKNDYIRAGQTVGYITSDSVVKNYENAKLDLDNAYKNLEKVVLESDVYSLDSTVNSARLSLNNAEIQLDEAKKNLEDYTITAPIDGTIVTKNKKAGEKLEQNMSNSEPMAVIYDMSILKVKLTIDESDILDIKTGQTVRITADAVEGVFEGEITKVGIDGTTQNGVTTYPVEVSISEYGDLLPGMNVDCVIEIESVNDVLCIPVSALQRGNTVYVKGKKTDDNDKAPDGYHSVSVKTGIADSKLIEVTEGLDDGDEIIVSLTPSGKEALGEQEDAMDNMMSGGPMHGGMSGGGGMPGGGMSGGGGMPGGGPK